MDRLHYWKLGKPVVKLDAFCSQGFLHPRGVLKFLIGLEMDFPRRLIETLQCSQEQGNIESEFSLSADGSRRFLQGKIHKSLIDFIMSLHIIGPTKRRDGLGK
jgi:hypothetical protein